MRRLDLLLFLVISACSTTTPQETFPIDFVLNNSIEQLDKLPIGDLEKYKTIDTTFIKKWFEGLPIPELDNKKLRCEEYLNGWYLIDHRRIDDKIVFSILGNGEAGILDLFYLTYDTVSKKVISINFLVGSYGDEGYYKGDLVEWADKNSIRITSKEVNIDDSSEFIKISKTDSFVTQFSYADRSFKAKEIFRHSKVDTIRTK
jgi:hypothetical protein